MTAARAKLRPSRQPEMTSVRRVVLLSVVCLCTIRTILLLNGRRTDGQSDGRLAAKSSAPAIDQLPATHQIVPALAINPDAAPLVSPGVKMDYGFAINCERTFTARGSPTTMCELVAPFQRINCTAWWSNLSAFIGKGQTPIVQRPHNLAFFVCTLTARGIFLAREFFYTGVVPR